MKYVDGFVAAVPTNNQEEYLKHAEEMGLVFKEYGALGIVETWGDDIPDGEPIVNEFRTMAEVPAETELSRTISKEMKRAGMNFVGPTIVYAYMQSAGLVDDHLVSCFKRR